MKQNSSFLKKLTNRQLEYILFVVMALATVVSFIEPLAQVFLLGMVLISPVVFGYGLGMVFDYMDQNTDYKVQISQSIHVRLAILSSLFIGALAKHLATQVPILPYTEITNALLMIVAPKILFFIWGVGMSGLGYYLAWKSFRSHKNQE